METAEHTRNNNGQEHYSSSGIYISTKLNNAVEQILHKENFIEYEINKKRNTEKKNFFGKVYEIDVKGKTKTEEKELHLFVKRIIYADKYAVSEMYETEMFAYEDLFKQFEIIQEQSNICLDERYKMIKVYEQSNPEMLIMDNIAKKGFTTISRMDVGTLDFFKMSVKELAKFHGLSFVIRETNPVYFEEKIKPLTFPLLFNEGWQYGIKSTKTATLKVVDEKFRDKVEKAFDLVLDNICQYYIDESTKVCLCHGDYRPCNNMIKRTDDRIQELISIDFQTIHYGCPVFDFLYLIFTGTDRKFRRSHMLTLKDLYYETLGNFLKQFKVDVENVYPKAEYEKVFKEKFEFGLLAATYILPFILTSGNQIADLRQDNLQFNYDKTFKDRIQDIIEEYIELGIL